MTTLVTLATPQISTTVRTLFRLGIDPLRHGAVRLGMAAASRWFPHWTVRTATRLFVTPPRFTQPGAERRLLAAGTRLDLETPVGRIAAWRFGDSQLPAIIVSHGWGGRGAQFRAFVEPLTAAGWQVWLFDHVGHGQSAGRQASLVDFATGLRAVHEHLTRQGVKVAGLLAHSLGGAAVAAALRGLKHTPAIDVPRAVLIAPPASMSGYSRRFAHYLGISERIRAAMQWRLEQRYGVAWREFEMPHGVASLKAEALVIHDHADRDVPFASGLAVARAWPGARLRTSHGLGHRRILKDGQVVADCVDFLRGEVRFSPPPVADDWAHFPEPAPLY